MAKRRLPKFLRNNEPERLIDVAPNPTARLMILCGIYLGLRVSEICKLKIEHLDLDQGTALISQAKGDKDRYVPIPLKFLDELRDWIGTRRDGYLFPSPRGGRYSTRMVQLWVKAMALDAEIGRRVTPHSLRHTYATRLLSRGASLREVQELLGHSSVATTEIYTAVLPERLRSAVERL